MIESDGFTVIEMLNSGTFSTQIARCETTESFSIEVFDSENNLQSNEEVFVYNNGITNVGNIIVCSNLDEYLSYTIDGIESILYTQDISVTLVYNLDPITFPAETYLISIDAYLGNGLEENCFRLIGILNDQFDELVGTYDYWYVEDETDLMGITFNGIQCGFAATLSNSAEFNITSITDVVGEFIDMNFSLDYFDLNGQLHTMQGEMHVRRDE